MREKNKRYYCKELETNSAWLDVCNEFNAYYAEHMQEQMFWFRSRMSELPFCKCILPDKNPSNKCDNKTKPNHT